MDNPSLLALLFPRLGYPKEHILLYRQVNLRDCGIPKSEERHRLTDRVPCGERLRHLGIVISGRCSIQMTQLGWGKRGHTKLTPYGSDPFRVALWLSRTPPNISKDHLKGNQGGKDNKSTGRLLGLFFSQFWRWVHRSVIFSNCKSGTYQLAQESITDWGEGRLMNMFLFY